MHGTNLYDAQRPQARIHRGGRASIHRRTICLLAALLALALPLSGSAAEFALRADGIRATVKYLCDEVGPRPAGTDAERAACDWLRLRLEDIGFCEAEGTLRRCAFAAPQEIESENLVAICNAGRTDLPLISIVAHYDSVDASPGARDNAAAVGILLELARALGPEAAQLPCEIRMAFLGSEENGYHGAGAYVQSLSEQDRARHLAAFNMDISAASPEDGAEPVIYILGGFQADGRYMDAEFLPECTNRVAQAAARAWEAAHGQAPKLFVYGQSDHVRFHEAKLEAVNLCWRRIEDGLPCLPASYHQPTDVPADLDWEAASQTGACILDAIDLLCEAESA